MHPFLPQCSSSSPSFPFSSFLLLCPESISTTLWSTEWHVKHQNLWAWRLIWEKGKGGRVEKMSTIWEISTMTGYESMALVVESTQQGALLVATMKPPCEVYKGIGTKHKQGWSGGNWSTKKKSLLIWKPFHYDTLTIHRALHTIAFNEPVALSSAPGFSTWFWNHKELQGWGQKHSNKILPTNNCILQRIFYLVNNEGNGQKITHKSTQQAHTY